MSPFPPSGNGGYIRNLDVPYLSVTTSYSMLWRHMGPMESPTSWTPSQPCDMQMLTSEHVTEKCHTRGCNFPTAPAQNSLNLVPAGTTEYIAAGDSQATVPFPTEIRRDFDLQWKTAGKRAFRRRALRRPHPARREVTCGDWYGLTQAWGSTTYDWIFGAAPT